MTANGAANNGRTIAVSLQAEVWRVAAQLEALPAAPETGHRLGDLATHFGALGSTTEAARTTAEERIWAIWCDHPESQAKARMAEGIRSLAAGDLVEAEAAFDELIADYPAWAEAWNKRATVYFLQGRDSASVGDIFQTFEREPRHFGALGGFAQICMRNGIPDAAQAALERLLALNPGAPGVSETVAALSQYVPKTMH